MTTPTTDPRLPEIMSQRRWRARPERFALVGISQREHQLALRLLPGVTGSFVQLVVEPDIVTLLLPDRDWRVIRPAFPHARVQQPLKVISFDLDLPEDLTGFLATVATALAAAGVPILAVCGFTKDHVVVRERDLSAALRAIEGLAGAP